ncbi:P-type conjugative transfer protein TrbL [Sphingomonas adhaesiva]|uniref:P-type conjugative transfer protein TrbL n=1 Tax=Sphingomonas adhaesiva TaxID=28212 RepID=UPI002FFAB7B0
MNDLNVIDGFLQSFITYIDAGFGLLGGDVRFLTATLIAIDVTLVGLFWALDGEQDVIGRLLKKVLYVGAFAFIIGNFTALGDIVFRSFARAGLTASGSGLAADDLLKPGKLAGTGFSAAWPVLDQARASLGIVSLLENPIVPLVLVFAWAIIILAFFVLAVQLFVTIIEFKLTALAGFVLVPFALWNRTAFLAERVLGNIVSSGIKVMVLAVIVGIGSTFFDQFTDAIPKGATPDIGPAMVLVMASLTLLGLGVFGPGIASGLVSGAPQLGAGAALGTTLGAAGATMLAGGAAVGAARAIGGAAIGAVRAGTALGSGASTAYALGQEAAGASTVRAGLGGVARSAGGIARQKAGDTLDITGARQAGRDAAIGGFRRDAPAAAADGGTAPAGTAATGSGAPAWARDMRRRQDVRHHAQAAVHTLQQGDRGGGGANPDIKETDR